MGVIGVQVQIERYAHPLVDRDNACWFNHSVRDTMRVVLFLSLTRAYPVHADDVALFTGLSPEFVAECLATLALEGFIRETEIGFQSDLDVERMSRQTHRSLDDVLHDIQEGHVANRADSDPVQVRSRSGAWDGDYEWPSTAEFL